MRAMVIDTPRLQLSQGEGWSESAHSIGAARPNSAPPLSVRSTMEQAIQPARERKLPEQKFFTYSTLAKTFDWQAAI